MRKCLGINQEALGAKLGISKAAVSMIEKGINGLSNQNIISICREFNVNEEWLLNGTGEMFIANDDTILSQLSAEYHLDNLETELIKTFLQLDEHQRKTLIDVALSFARNVDNLNVKKEPRKLRLLARGGNHMEIDAEKFEKNMHKLDALENDDPDL